MDTNKQREGVDEFERSMEELLLDEYEKKKASFDRREWFQVHHESHMLLLEEWHQGSIINALPSNASRQKRPRCFTELNRYLYEATLKNEVHLMHDAKHLDECEHQDDYIRALHLLYYAEEAYQAVIMRRSDCNMELNWRQSWNGGGDIYSCAFKFPNLSDRTPPVAISDYVLLKNPADGYAVLIMIENIHGDWVYLQPAPAGRHAQRLGTSVNIAFLSSGTPFHFCHLAIDVLAISPTMQEIVFDKYKDPPNKLPKIDIEATSTPELEQRLARLNESQQQAVRGILEARCRPKPYIVYGPPGTGKSQTLVEAVVQVYWRTRRKAGDSSPEAGNKKFFANPKYVLRKNLATKILVCVNSNVCTDILFERLSSQLPGDAALSRLSAGDRTNQPQTYDIIVTTNIKSGTLCDRMQFDFLFVDEAGHSNACESLVPVCLLKPDGCLVLAGDLKQLLPLVLCGDARDLGLGRSLLACVQPLPLYQRCTKSGRLDERSITMLTDCYRCDPRVLAPSNKLFYDNALRCLNATPSGLLKLLKISSPLQLVLVGGQEEKPLRSASWRNLEESRVCANLVLRLFRMGIEPDQVGVATPYRAQSKDIYTSLRLTLDDEQSELRQDRFPILETVKKIWTGEQAEAMMQVYEGHMKAGDFFDEKVSLTSTYKKIDGNLVQATRADVLDTPFKLFERRVSRYSSKEQICKVDTIDGFQGNERPIMIISTVRTNPNSDRLEFLHEDYHRFNVATSRSKWLTILVGNADVLKVGKYWPEFVANAKSELEQR